MVVEEAQRVLDVTKAARIPLLINDRADVALAVGADGVHVGQEDLPVSVVRQIVGPERIVGKSTHSLEHALAAEQEGADYLAVGPIYPTPTKPEYPSVGLKVIGQVKACVSIPIVTIGGIDHKTLPQVLAAGAECVAVVRAVCGAADVEHAARKLKQAIINFASQNLLTGGKT